MAARKLQQEIDKEVKIIGLGIAEFDGIFEKLTSSNNASQRAKLEDSTFDNGGKMDEPIMLTGERQV
jgi:hypothetical protein